MSFKNRFCFSPTLLTFVILFLISGCAMFDNRETQKKEVKDVAFDARKEEVGPRKRVVVLPFLDHAEYRPQSLRDQSRKIFVSQLNRTPEAVVIDTQELKLDMAKLKLNTNEYNMTDAAKAAMGLSVAAVIEGKLLDIKVSRKADPVGVFRQVKTKFEATVRIRMFSSRGGKEIFNTIKTVTLEEANIRVAENATADKVIQMNPELLEKLVSDAFLDFIPQLIETLNKLSWEGRIAMINGERIFLNVGRLSGLQIGDILRVSEDGDEVFDPQSGRYIGKVPGKMKGTLEVVSYFGQDGAIATIHSGAGFKENDKVELYQ